MFKKLFKKIMDKPILQFMVVAAIAYFTAGAGAGAAQGATAGGTAGATGGAAGATGTVGAGQAATTTGAAAGEFAAQEAAKQAAAQAATQQAGTLATEQVATNAAAQVGTQAGADGLVAQNMVGGPAAADHLTNQAVKQGVGEATGPGVFSKIGGFVEKNPMASAMMFNAASSAMSPDEVDLMREQERIRRDRWKNMGVPDSVGFQPSGRALYYQDGRPVHDAQGIISRGMQQ